MEENNQQTNFLKDAKILAVGIFISRLLGLLFVFPFAKMVGSSGVALYTYAYVPYTLFLDLSTLGIPMGLSKLVAKYNAKNDFETSRRIFKYSALLMTAIGFISFLLVNLLAGYYAKMVLGGNQNLINNHESVVLVIRIISLPLLIVPIISSVRGYFQGHFFYYPTAISQVIEQVIRVGFILVSAYLVLFVFKESYEKAVNYSVFAAFLGALFALLFLFFELKRRKLWCFKKLEKKQSKKLILEIIKFSLPFAIFGVSFSCFQLIDSLFFNKALLAFGISDPENYYGLYSFNVQKLVFIPISLFLCLGTTIMPDITKDLAAKDYANIKQKAEKSFEWVFLILLPVTFFMFFYSHRIYNIFYTKETLGGDILQFYSLIIIVIVINGLLVNILQGINVLKKTIFAIGLGLLVKLLTCYAMIRFLGYQGAIFSSILGYSVTIIFNFFSLRQKIRLESKTLSYFLKCFALSAVGIIILLGVQKLFIINDDRYFINLLATAILFLLLIVLYVFAIFKAHLWPKQIK